MVARSQFYDVPDLNVHELLLDASNPRIRHGVDQHDCVERIVKDRDTFMNLLRDIAAHGLTPEHILVSPNGDGKWVVRDGNRRVTALKLLTRPSLCLPNEQLYNTVQRIVNEMPVKLGETQKCLACDDDEVIVDYLRRKHTGENLGIGQVGWDALLISLFNVQAGIVDQNRRAAQLILWAEDHGLSIGNKFPITTLNRALNADTLKTLGFRVENDQLLVTLKNNQAYALVARVIGDIAAGRVHVKRDGENGSIYSPEDATAYILKVREEMGPHDAEKQKDTEVVAGEPAASNGNGPASGSGSPTNGTTNTPRGGAGRPTGGTAKPFWVRPCLFGRRKNSNPGFSVPANEAKLSTIVSELRQVDPFVTPLATTMLLRALIERSEIFYREKHNLTDKKALHTNIAASADHMKTSGLLSKSEHDAVMRHTRTDPGMLHIKTIQACIHENQFHPNGQTLNTTWDEIGCFVRACWVSMS